MSGRVYEDFEVGMIIRHSLGRTVSATGHAVAETP